jgi:hypothetical protein
MANFIVKLFIIAVALVLLIIGVYKISSFYFIVKQSNIQTGIVVKKGMGKFTGCKPFIEFYDNEGIKREFKSEINYYVFFCPNVGDKIEVLSLKSNPSNAISYNFIHNIFIPAFLICIAFWIIRSIHTQKSTSGDIEKVKST